jgi:branched-chain amino acid aminotransferase
MKTIPAISMNETLVTPENAKVSVFDHGFLYGDGVFEGIRIYKNRIFRVEKHINRLFRSAKVIGLEIGVSKESLINEIKKVAAKWAEINSVDLYTNEDPLYIRVVVSRGYGDLGLDHRENVQNQVVSL